MATKIRLDGELAEIVARVCGPALDLIYTHPDIAFAGLGVLDAYEARAGNPRDIAEELGKVRPLT